jgi:sugar (pentulose or hexulose) kinase
MFVGIDVGTSFIKGAVLDADRLQFGQVQRLAFPKPLPGPSPRYWEYDPAAILAAVRRLLDQLLAEAGDCEGVVMCSQMHGLVFVTEDGEPRSNVITWQDQRALEPHVAGQGTYFDGLRRQLAPETIRQLGNDLRPGLPVSQCYWLAAQRRLPEGKIIPASLPDFIVANLCATTPVTELTNAMSHGALNLETLGWHHEAIGLLGLDGLCWPAIRPQGAVVGWLPVGSRRVPCYTPVGDAQCALAGALLQTGELSLNIATGSQVSMLKPHIEFGDYATRPFFDGQYLVTVADIPAGRALSLLVRLLSELAQAQGLELADPWPYIAAAADQAGQTSLRADLAFFRSDCGDHGEITNIREETLAVGHLFRAGFQNMADNYYACAQRLSPDQAWRQLVFSGGLAQKLGTLRQLICDKFKSEYRFSPASEDTVLGLLALALAFSGRAGSVAQATTRLLALGPNAPWP